jgi:hypothetical protein
MSSGRLRGKPRSWGPRYNGGGVGEGEPRSVTPSTMQRGTGQSRLERRKSGAPKGVGASGEVDFRAQLLLPPPPLISPPVQCCSHVGLLSLALALTVPSAGESLSQMVSLVPPHLSHLFKEPPPTPTSISFHSFIGLLLFICSLITSLPN